MDGTSEPTIVIPTVGRDSLAALLTALSGFTGPVHVIDDRPASSSPLPIPGSAPPLLRVLRSGGRGPAAARNVGWRAARTPWVVFLDDDVLPGRGWVADLEADLRAADIRRAVGSSAQITVPRPSDRPPTDAERAVIGLETARWITADMAYRRRALAEVGGFDERFLRAYREDADLALRLRTIGGRIIRGRRRTTHPLRRDPWWTSVRAQRGNADDVLMRRRHGRRWRSRIGEGRGRRVEHVLTTAALLGLAAAAPMARRSAIARRVAAASAATWVLLTVRFDVQRLRHGPRTAAEVAAMTITSAVIPPCAVAWTAIGLVRHHMAGPWLGPPDLVVLDRDGTIVIDVPYNADPGAVRIVPGVRAQLDRLRDRGIALAMATNQSGVAHGLISPDQLDAVNARVAELTGPFDLVLCCPHAPDAGCPCRKPQPGMVLRACDALQTVPERCVVVGDIGSDVEAAQAAGAGSVLVPTPTTRACEIARAPLTVQRLSEAVDLILDGRWR